MGPVGDRDSKDLVQELPTTEGPRETTRGTAPNTTPAEAPGPIVP